MNEILSKKVEEMMDERFGCDTLLSVATVSDGKPCVRLVNSYYTDGAFYVVTHALSNKMKQLEKNPNAAVCGEWFSAQGIGENIGHICAKKNAELADILRTVFAEWYSNGHTDESDPNTCILRIRLTKGVLFYHGTRYDIDFTKGEL